MLKLNAAFNKKIPVAGEQYSSQSYHCSVEVELSDAASPEQLQTKIAETFALVRDAVESELHGKPAAKVEPAAQPAKAEPRTAEAPAKATNHPPSATKVVVSISVRRTTTLYRLRRKTKSRLPRAFLTLQ